MLWRAILGQKSMSADRDGTTANGRANAFLTTFVWAPTSENAFLVVILAVKDAFETFWGPITAGRRVYGGHFSMSADRDGSTANGKANALLTIFV